MFVIGQIVQCILCNLFVQNAVNKLIACSHATKQQVIGARLNRYDFFPIQIICTGRLTDEDNFWLHNLSDRIHTKEQTL